MANLNGDEIVAIIRAGHRCQVATLELGDIKITYKGSEPVAAQTQPIYPILENNPTQQPQTVAKPQFDELNELLLDLVNPGEYERRKLNGDLDAEA